MAFSTQKDFLRIDFLKDQTNQVATANNQNRSIMKTYKSCTDARAWSMENQKRAKYLWDAVQRISNVEFVPNGDDGRGDNFNTIRLPNKIAEAELNNLSKDQLIQHILELYKNFENIKELFHDTVNKLQNIHAIINENDELQLKLNESNDKLQKLSKENESIKNNTIQYDSDDWNYEFNDPKNSNKEDEKELIKLRERLKALTINIEPEKSTDVKYLHALINDMRKEISILKRFEKELVHLKILNNNLKDQVHESLSDIHRQSSQIAVVMNERDQLRKQLDKMIDIEDKLKAIIERAKLTDELENERNILLDKLQKANYELKLMEPNRKSLCNDEQNKIENYDKIMQELEYYKKKYSDINEKCRESSNLYNELYQTKRQLKCAENAIAKYEEDIQFQIELINHLNHELQKRDNTLLKNEQRFNVMKNLRNEVKELQKQLMETIQDTVVIDNNINIVKNQQHVDEIISVASNTLSFIQDEFSARKELNENVKRLDSKISDLAKQSSTSLHDSTQISNISIINDSLILNEEYKIENDFSIQMPEFPNEHEIEDLNLTNNEQHQETLANEITELKNQLAQKNYEITKLNNTIKDLDCAILELKNLKERQDELKKLSNLNEITEIKNQLDGKDKEIIDLNNKIKDLHSKNLEYENLNLTNNKQHEETLSSEITELKNQLVQKDKEIIELKNISKQSENDNNIDLNLSLDLEKLQNELKRMSDLNDKFFNEITELKELLNQKKNENIDELKNKSNENHELLDNKYIDLENLQNIKINYENEIEKLKLNLIDNDKQLEHLTNSLNKRNNEFIELENALKQVQEKLEKQQQLLINEKHEWNSQYNDKTNALIQAQQKLTECEDHCDNLESIVNENKYKISNLNEQINSLNNEYIFCKTQLDDNKAATDLLKIKLKESQNDLSDVKKTASVNDLELLNIKNVNDKKDNELNQLKATSSNLEKQLQDNNIIVSDLTNQIKSLKLNNTNLRTEITELKQQMDELNNIVIDIDKERDHNQELQMELNQFQARLELLQQESSQKLKSISIKDITSTSEIDDSIKKFKLQLDEECKRNDELENLNKKLKDEINVMKSQINLNQKNTEIKSKLELMQASSTQLAKQIHEHSKEKKEIQFKYDQLLAENDVLKKRITEYCADKKKCLNKIKDLQDEISLLEKNPDNSTRYNSLKDNTIESKLTEKEIADIRKNFAIKLTFYVNKIASLNAENNVLKIKIDAITADNNENNDTILRTHNYENDNNKSNVLGCQCEQSDNQKLKQLCQIIIENNIDTLSFEELKFMHEQVYTAGLKKRPDIKIMELTDFKINADEKSVDNQQMLSRINNIEKALQREEQSLKNVQNTIRNDNDHKIMIGDNNGGDNPVKIPRNNLSNRKNVNTPTKLNKMKINNSKQYKTSRNGGSNVEGDGIRSISINTKYKPIDSNRY